MYRHTLALLLCAAGAAPIVNGDEYKQAAEQAEATWADWAKEALTSRQVEQNYSLLTSSDSRVLIWHPKGTSKSKLKSVSGKAVATFDKLFDPSTREATAPERRSAVLFPIAGPKSFQAITAHAAEVVPRLAGWAPTATAGVGFLLEEPLAAGWLLEVPESEVWNVENELVNRLARLLTVERFGRQPHWIAQGIAWHVELAVCKDVYCFPFRTGFVSKKEHTTWPKRLSEVMAARGEAPLTEADLCDWKRSTWQADKAALAWGAVAMLADHYEDEFPSVLHAFFELRNKDGRVTESDGSWTVIPDYEIPAEKQLEILKRELGVDFLAEIDRYARNPKGYRRPHD